jgi:hypothetical protein
MFGTYKLRALYVFKKPAVAGFLNLGGEVIGKEVSVCISTVG